MKIHRKDNFIVAVVLLVLVAFFLWQTYTTLPASATASDMGPRFMPTVTLVAIAILPVIIVYLLLSKFIVRGVALGGVKG